MGCAQALSMPHVDRFSLRPGILILADRGITFAGHITRAHLLGTSYVIMGRMFAGSGVAPGKHIYEDEVRLKLGWKK